MAMQNNLGDLHLASLLRENHGTTPEFTITVCHPLLSKTKTQTADLADEKNREARAELKAGSLKNT